VGIRRLGGHLAGGMTEWRREQRPVQRIERLEVTDLAARVDVDPALQLLDVREVAEHDAGFIPGAAFTPWHDIHGIPDGVDAKRPVAVMCASGERAAVASSLMQRHGAGQVIHVVGGGVPTWGRLGRPLERATATG
jgi:rhodanese-related sulfurtransferase